MIRREYIIIGLILLIAAILRFYTIGDRSLWMDEIWQVQLYYSQSAGELIYNAAAKHAQPPLDYLIGYTLLKLFPFSEAIVRLPAAVFGILSVYFVYIIAKDIYSNVAATIAAVLTAISSHLIQYSQEARPYAIFSAALLMTLYFYLRAIKSERRLYWIGFGISLYFLLMTRGFEPLVAVLVLNLMTPLFYRISRKTIYVWAISGLAFILYLPFFIKIYEGLKRFSENNDTQLVVQDGIIHRLKDFSFGEVLSITQNLTYPVSLLFLIFIIAGLVYIFAISKDKIASKLFACFIFITPVIHYFIYSYKVNMSISPFYPRYYIYTLPFIYIIASTGIEGIWLFIRSRVRYKYINYGFAVLVFIFILAYGTNLKAYYSSNKQDWRGVSKYIKEISGENDVLLMYYPHRGLGKWVPGFEGKNVYYREVKEFTINELIDFAAQNKDYKGNIILTLYFERDSYKYFCCKDLCNKYFYKFCVYKHENNHKAFIDGIEELIDKLIIRLPETGSHVRLYLSKAKIHILRGEKDKGLQYVKMAAQATPKGYEKVVENMIREVLLKK